MKTFKLWGVGATVSLLCLLVSSLVSEAGTLTAGKTHIGTFEGTTTFTTSSSNGINPGLFLEVRDADGNLKQYESEEGVITVENTKEGAYVTQAKLLGKTKYRDQDSGELLDEWEAGRNLTLESVQMPVLTTTGKNLFDENRRYESSNKLWFAIPFEKDSYFTFSSFDTIPYIEFYGTTTEFIDKLYGGDGVSWKALATFSNKESGTFKKESKYNYIIIAFDKAKLSNGEDFLKNLQVEQGTQATPYEPYKSNILTVNEEVELRGLGDMQDELNCLTGEFVQRIGEIILDDGLTYTKTTVVPPGTDTNIYSRFYIENIPNYNSQRMFADRFRVDGYNYIGERLEYGTNGRAGIMILKSRLTTDDVNGLKAYLRSNPITIQYKLATESIKTVGLNATYEFNLVSDSVVKVHGDILPTIYSITVPSEPLTFTIDPNAETGKQFIAPEFEITNQSPGPIQLELKAFEQVTNLFNDVLPDEHEDWSQLNKKQSKDIALALVPQPSDAWLTLNEGPKYVVNSANTLLGEIRKDATVHFSFSAYHGGVFEPNLSPEYRLVFTFGF